MPNYPSLAARSCHSYTSQSFCEQKAKSNMMEKVPDNVNDVSKESLYFKTRSQATKVLKTMTFFTSSHCYRTINRNHLLSKKWYKKCCGEHMMINKIIFRVPGCYESTGDFTAQMRDIQDT